MDLQLDLLENSYDFLNNALFYYNKANLDDGHEEGQANFQTKLFWKTGFILLVQSLELILKEALRRKSDVLVYENIDTPFSSDSKTISFQNSVQRLLNLATNFISTEQKDFILNCGKIRNQFIHYKVKYNSIDIKKKFCKLVELYSVIHKKTTKEKIRIWKENEYYYKYCPHCIAKLGEYHLEMCSHEICSRCGEQLMCCDCAEGMIHIDLQDSKIN